MEEPLQGGRFRVIRTRHDYYHSESGRLVRVWDQRGPLEQPPRSLPDYWCAWPDRHAAWRGRMLWEVEIDAP